MPAALRRLLETELAAGNTLTEVGHGHPAPPVGACFHLGQPLRTRARNAADGFRYRQRNSSLHSGELTDETGHFFLLEPPLPPPPPPDMDAIRAAANGTPPLAREDPPSRDQPPDPPDSSGRTSPPRQGPVDRFVRSLSIDYEKWREGIGYDLDAIRQASPAERSEIESILLGRTVEGWREVEALAVLDTPRTRQRLVEALDSPKPEVRMAITRHAPHLVPTRRRVESLVRALGECRSFEGLGDTLNEVAELHPPAVMRALFRGVREREGAVAVHFAAMLYFLHGLSREHFDWDHRPFFLRFHTEDPTEREQAYRELCERLGVDPAQPVAGRLGS